MSCPFPKQQSEYFPIFIGEKLVALCGLEKCPIIFQELILRFLAFFDTKCFMKSLTEISLATVFHT